VNKNANEFVIGTVKDNSACPIKRKNLLIYQHQPSELLSHLKVTYHTLPVTFNSSGTAYAGFLSKSITA